MEKIDEKRNGMNERNEKMKCLIWNKGKIEISEFPPQTQSFYIINSINLYYNYSKSFISDLEDIIKNHTIDELLESGLISIFIENNDELIFRDNKYTHIKTEQLQEGDIVVKFSTRKRRLEKEIVSTPASYWLAVGEAFVYKGNKSSAPAHSAPAPRPERRGDRQARQRR